MRGGFVCLYPYSLVSVPEPRQFAISEKVSGLRRKQFLFWDLRSKKMIVSGCNSLSSSSKTLSSSSKTLEDWINLRMGNSSFRSLAQVSPSSSLCYLRTAKRKRPGIDRVEPILHRQRRVPCLLPGAPDPRGRFGGVNLGLAPPHTWDKASSESSTISADRFWSVMLLTESFV